MRRGLMAATPMLAAIAATRAIATPPQVEPYGTLADGRSVERYTLRNAHGMTVRVLTYAGVITEISVPALDGTIGNVVLTKPDLAGYVASPSYSSLLGRYANRISGGGFTLDGRRYDLAGAAANGMVLHGGPDALSQQVWRTKPFGGRTGSSGIVFSIVSPDAANGFPGTLRIQVRYTLEDTDTLRLDYEATTDKPTVVNLSHHVYFNLAGEGASSADDQCVQILADRYAEAKMQAMTGALRSVEGTPFDLRRPTRLGDRINKGDPLLPRGYDTPFVVRREGDRMMPAARAWDPATGRMMELRTNETSIQFFTPNIRPATSPPLGVAPVVPHAAGYAIETEHLPESPNYPSFPSTILRPGQTFRSATSWHFGTYAPVAGTCPSPASS